MILLCSKVARFALIDLRLVKLSRKLPRVFLGVRNFE